MPSVNGYVAFFDVSPSFPLLKDDENDNGNDNVEEVEEEEENNYDEYRLQSEIC